MLIFVYMDIRVENIVKEENSIVVKFSCSDGLKRFFPLSEFVVEYSVDVADTPDSLAVIPFVCNVLPIVWLTDSTLFLPDFDSAFVQGLPAIKEAYQEMHPSMPFKGSVHTTRITDNINLQYSGSNTAAFFSGGADAFATLIDHATESPMLITLWGADIKLSDTEGWNRVIDHARQTALDFGTESLWIKSNFRSFLNEGELDSLVRSSGDGWWHGFQHGIGLIGHAAPLVWAKGLGTLYIAASRSAGHPGNSPCASVPAIDNNVQMSACRTVHDQYEFDRIDKIQHIVDYVTLTNLPISLRTCWLSRGGVTVAVARNVCVPSARYMPAVVTPLV